MLSRPGSVEDGLASISAFARENGTRECVKVVAPDDEGTLGLVTEVVLMVVLP